MQTTNNPSPKRVLIVEDDFLVGEKLRGMLEDESYQVIDHTGSGRQAIEMTASLRPDVVIMDINLLEMDGLAAARQITAQCPTPIVALTAHESPDLVAQATESGIGYYLVKPASRRDVSRAIEIAAARFDDLMQMRELNAALKDEIAKRRQTEKAILQERERLDNILSALETGLTLINPDMTIAWTNRKIAQMFPHPQAATGQLCHRFYERQETPCEGCGTQIAFQTGEVHIHERKNPLTGRWYTIIAQPIQDAQGKVINVLEGITDITKRKQAEVKLLQYANHLEEMVDEKVRELEQERAKAIQLDKMAALGEMATSVAHELNQPLTAITFEADFLKTFASRLSASEQSVEEIAASLAETAANFEGDIERCRRIVDHLRTFGRIAQEPPQPIDLNQPISDCFILADARLRHSEVDVRLDLVDDLPPILADPHKLEQVFLNLISNAEYAMEKQAERESQRDYRKVLEIATAVEGEHVVARVRDNGCGIPPEDQKRLFDPFFTTKPPGEGTGLGLSISYGIVTEVGGDIEFESVAGEGTTFTLKFPISS